MTGFIRDAFSIFGGRENDGFEKRIVEFEQVRSDCGRLPAKTPSIRDHTRKNLRMVLRISEHACHHPHTFSHLQMTVNLRNM